jgi:hypothetical protein
MSRDRYTDVLGREGGNVKLSLQWEAREALILELNLLRLRKLMKGRANKSPKCRPGMNLNMRK